MACVALAMTAVTAACGSGQDTGSSSVTEVVSAPPASTTGSASIVDVPQANPTSQAASSSSVATSPSAPSSTAAQTPSLKLLGVDDGGCVSDSQVLGVSLDLTFQTPPDLPLQRWTPIFDPAKNKVWTPKISEDGPHVILNWDHAPGAGTVTASPTPGITSFGGNFVLTMKPPSGPAVDVQFTAHVDCTSSP
jgi:hypothetical protein